MRKFEGLTVTVFRLIFLVFDLQLAQAINVALEEHFPETSGVRIIAEPGRYFAASVFTLCTNIIAKRVVSETLPVRYNLFI